ncbi:MAG: GAF domain-containing protein, partial [Betaproteobacteria bacterium]
MSERKIAPSPFGEGAIEERLGSGLTANPSIDQAVDANPHHRYRGRLFRKYLLLILSLVTIALLASGAISVYFSYQENKSALAGLQHEKALAAATRIEQYIEQIVKQLVYAALPQLDANDVELRRIEFLKLLRQAPEVTDIVQLDTAGREQIAVSRLGMDNINSGKDRSQEPAFRNARRGQQWFGPVYFKKETEPYMTIAIRSGSDTGPVTIADVNLKFIWDVVSRIKIGEKGKAYVVDDNGFLVADPDIGLVLRKTNLGHLPHVKAAAGKQSADEPAMVSLDMANIPVLTSVAPIESLKWNVFIEQPVSEVYAKLNASILRTAALLIAGLVISALAALALARGMVRPIRTLDEGARRIAAGELDQKIEVRTGDELEALANQFNRMTGRLRESYAGLERKVEERTHELKNSLEQQTAISEILRVISSSPTDVQPVLQAVAERAAHLCNAPFARVLLIDHDELRPMTDHSVKNEPLSRPSKPIPLKRSAFTSRAVLDRQTIHHADIVPLLETEYPDSRDSVIPLGARAVLAVPLMREGGAYGGIFLFRREPRLFSSDQVALVETFARQAAIAIDNVRLFNETRETLEQQTAISEILRVISSSPSDVRPMLNAVAERALTLCDAAEAGIFLVDGETLRFTTGFGSTPNFTEGERFPLTRGSLTGRAVIEGVSVHVEDLAIVSEAEFPVGLEMQKRIGHHAALSVPLMREDRAIGSIALWRMEARRFTDKQVALVKTFADQAAIAIENVRLFNATKEALERQTATAEILSVISGSPTSTAPVFEAILESSARLCEADMGLVVRYEKGIFQTVATLIPDPAFDAYMRQPIIAGPTTGLGRIASSRQPVHIPDLIDDEAYRAGDPLRRRSVEVGGVRTWLGVPMLREGELIGVIAIYRKEVRPFEARQVEVLRTFADQAVIAIENVRLFNETKEALEQQTAVAEILRAISSSPTDVQPVLDAIAERAARLCDAAAASMYLTDGTVLRHLASKGPSPDPVSSVEVVPINRDSISGRALLERRTIVVNDMLAAGAEYPLSFEIAQRHAARTLVVVPLSGEDKPFGTIVLRRQEVRPFSERELAVLQTFGDQAAIALKNVRLFEEIQEKSRQVEIASQHKMQFLANMSHELRTPLNAILGYTELMFDGIYGPLEDRALGVLERVQHNGKHLLGLINDVLDLSKVDAGQLTLVMDGYSMSALVKSTVASTESLAQAKGLALTASVEEELPLGWGDERRLSQVLLNIVGNAIKFTDQGKVEVVATAADGKFQIEVRDT